MSAPNLLHERPRPTPGGRRHRAPRKSPWPTRPVPSLPTQAVAPQLEPRWDGVERRSQDRLSRLTREHDQLCTAAVDAAEIAAGLESAGFTDGRARDYGFPDVFAMAEAMFAATPRLVNRAPGQLFNPWSVNPAEHLLRGLAFAAPGLLFIACLPAATTALGHAILIASLMLGWPASQTVAFAWHLMEGRRHLSAGRAALLCGLVAALALSVLLGLAGALAGVPIGIILLACGQVAYLSGSAVVLVSRRTALALVLLAPGLLGALLATVTERPVAAFVGAGVSLVGCLGAAGWLLRSVSRADLTIMPGLFQGADRRQLCWQAGYGLGGASLVCLAAFGAGSEGDSLILLPLIWSMGFAEWQIVSFRRHCFGLLSEAPSVRHFRSAVRRAARGGLLRYLASLALLSVVVVIVTSIRGASLLAVAHGLAAGALLGVAFYLSLIVSSMGSVSTVAKAMFIVITVALAAQFCWPPAAAELLAPALLIVALCRPYLSIITDPTRHM